MVAGKQSPFTFMHRHLKKKLVIFFFPLLKGKRPHFSQGKKWSQNHCQSERWHLRSTSYWQMVNGVSISKIKARKLLKESNHSKDNCVRHIYLPLVLTSVEIFGTSWEGCLFKLHRFSAKDVKKKKMDYILKIEKWCQNRWHLLIALLRFVYWNNEET